MKRGLLIVLLFIVVSVSGCTQSKPHVDINECSQDSDCRLYIEHCGDPAGGVNCLNTKYQDTCLCCSLLDSTPEGYTCSCENNHCVGRINGNIR